MRDWQVSRRTTVFSGPDEEVVLTLGGVLDGGPVYPEYPVGTTAYDREPCGRRARSARFVPEELDFGRVR